MYQTLSNIKSGAYGTVFEARTSDSRTVAIKCNVKEGHIDGICNIREVAILNNYKHPHIVDMIDYYIDDGNGQGILDKYGRDMLNEIMDERYSEDNLVIDDIYMVLEYADNDGDEVIKNGVDSDMDKMLLHTLLALEYIHNSDIVHLDIKADNILYFKDQDRYKLCDMGLCMHVNKVNIVPPNICIEAFRSPELLIKLISRDCGENDKSYDVDLKAVDIWCVGMTWTDYLYECKDIFTTNEFDKMDKASKNLVKLYNMLLLEHDSDDVAELRKIGTSAMKYYEEYFVEKSTKYTINIDYSKMPDLLKKMLHINPKKRWTATQCLDSDHFKGYRQYITEVRSKYTKVDDIQSLYKSKYNIMLDSIDNETFTADRLFNEYMYYKYDMNINSPDDKLKYAIDHDDLVLYRYVCWYIMHKYYGVMLHTAKFPLDVCRELFTDKYTSSTDEQVMTIAMKYERDILKHFSMRVYRNNPIDHTTDYNDDNNLSYLTYYISRSKPGIYPLSDYMNTYNSLSTEEKMKYMD